MSNIRDIDFSVEWFFRTSHSSGKGGQNVNKVSTKVELCFNVFESKLLPSDYKELILSNLSTRISSTGLLRVSSGRERSQLANKKTVIERFYMLLEKAVDVDVERIPTKPTYSSIIKKKEFKEKKSEKKQRRKLTIKEEY